MGGARFASTLGGAANVPSLELSEVHTEKPIMVNAWVDEKVARLDNR